MKIIMLSAVLLLSFQSAFASCKSDFAALQNKEKVKLQPIRELTLAGKKDLNTLREAEKKAVLNYIKYLEFKFDGESELFVTTAQYQSKDGYNSSLGYRISVSDGGDESTVTYYIKIDVGLEDVAYPILYRFYDNQSPERDFLCETY